MLSRSASPFVWTVQRTGDRGGGGGGGGVLWKSHCQLLGRGDPVSKSHGDLSCLGCCCQPSCEREADAILYKKFHQHFELHSVVRIFQIDGYAQSFFPSSGILRRNRMSESGCVFSSGFFFPALYPPSFGGSMCLVSRSRASFLATIRSISFPVVFCIVRIRYPFSLLWSLFGFGIGLR